MFTATQYIGSIHPLNFDSLPTSSIFFQIPPFTSDISVCDLDEYYAWDSVDENGQASSGLAKCGMSGLASVPNPGNRFDPLGTSGTSPDPTINCPAG